MIFLILNKKILLNINSVTKIVQYPISFESFLEINDFDNIDYIFDCSDNYVTKTNSSLFAKAKSIAYSSISISSSEGIFFSQSYLKENDSYCFKCLFPNIDETNHRCLNSAMIGPVAGFVASLACLTVCNATKFTRFSISAPEQFSRSVAALVISFYPIECCLDLR